MTPDKDHLEKSIAVKNTYSQASLTITNNKFTMPAQAVTVTATFVKKNYTITAQSSTTGGGTITVQSTAQMGDTVSISQVPNEGYYFNGWTTSPEVTIENGQFTMPAGNLNIYANYLQRSTASVSSNSPTGGHVIGMEIFPMSSSYTHKYKLSFGTNMETAWVDVAAGVTRITSISVPESWSNYIPNDTSKAGTMQVQTYNGETCIGTYTINMTYNVPATAVPVLGTITKSVARTIGQTTFANIGDIYTQNHCGVRVQGSASGALGATITQMKVSVAGYSGSDYESTVSTGSIDFTSGLLTTAGTATITVTATDSRGRTVTTQETVTVTAYNAPAGTLAVKRVDLNGDDDDVGQYAKYEISKSYTAIGSNTLTVTLTSQGSSGTLSQDTGDILPGTGNRQTFSTQLEYTITLTLADAFETVTVTAKLRSAKFIVYASADGNHLGLMKATNKSIPAGKNATIEFSGDAQIYIGDQTLEAFIQSVVNNM